MSSKDVSDGDVIKSETRIEEDINKREEDDIHTSLEGSSEVNELSNEEKPTNIKSSFHLTSTATKPSSLQSRRGARSLSLDNQHNLGSLEERSSKGSSLSKDGSQAKQSFARRMEQELFDVALVKRRIAPKAARLSEQSSQARGTKAFIRTLLFPFYLAWWEKKQISRTFLQLSTIAYLLHVVTSFKYFISYGTPKALAPVELLELMTPYLLLMILAIIVGQAAATSPNAKSPQKASDEKITQSVNNIALESAVENTHDNSKGSKPYSSNIDDDYQESSPASGNHGSPISPYRFQLGVKRNTQNSLSESPNRRGYKVMGSSDDDNMSNPKPKTPTHRRLYHFGGSAKSSILSKGEFEDACNEQYDDDDDDEEIYADDSPSIPLIANEGSPPITVISATNEHNSNANNKSNPQHEHFQQALGDNILKRHYTAPIENPPPPRNRSSSLSEADKPVNRISRNSSLEDFLDPIKSVHWSSDGPKKIEMSLPDIRNEIDKKIASMKDVDNYALFAKLAVICTTLVPLSFRWASRGPSFSCWISATIHSTPQPILVLYNTVNEAWMLFVDFISDPLLEGIAPVRNRDYQNHTTLDQFYSSSCNQSAFLTTPAIKPDSAKVTDILHSLFVTLFGSSLYSLLAVLVCTLSSGLLSFAFFHVMLNAEDAFRKRMLFAKYFSKLTSSRRSRKAGLPHFRLYKVEHIKIWLSLRARRSDVDQSTIGVFRASDVTANVLMMLSLVCLTIMSMRSLGPLLNEDDDSAGFNVPFHILFDQMSDWFFFVWSIFLGVFMYRFSSLTTRTQKKYENTSVLLTEQLNVFMKILRKPHRKEELGVCNNMLKVAIKLLRELEGSGKKHNHAGALMSPFVFNLLRVIFLSAAGALSGRVFGFKVRMWKL